MSKTLKMKRNRQKYKCTSLPWWIFALASISSQLLTGSCKGKQILVRTCWRTSWIYCTERYHWLLVVYPLSDSSNDLLSFISAKKPWRRKIFAFFELKSSVQFLKHCYSIPANRKLTSFKIIEGKLRDHHLLCGSKLCLVFKLTSPPHHLIEPS